MKHFNMASAVVLAIAFLAAPHAADAQQRTTVQQVKPQRATTQTVAARPVSAKDVGVCLNGNKATLISGRVRDTGCESVIWINVSQWAQNQRKLIDGKSASSTLAAPQGTALSCKSCSGTCQTVSWISGGSSYEEVDIGGGQSPSECVDAVKELCESGAARFLFSAHCGN
jgi:hypothetical protein